MIATQSRPAAMDSLAVGLLGMDAVPNMMVETTDHFFAKIAVLSARRLLLRGEGRVEPGRGVRGERNDEFGMPNDEWRPVFNQRGMAEARFTAQFQRS